MIMMIVMKTMINYDDDNDVDSNDDDDDQTINFQIFFHTFIYEF